MAKKRDRRRTNTRPPARPRVARPPEVADSTGGIGKAPETELLGRIDKALRESHPLEMLLLVSTLLAALDPRDAASRGKDSFQSRSQAAASAALSLNSLAESFLGAGLRQTDAALKVIAEMAGDELLRARIRKQVAERRLPLPGWLLRLDLVEPSRAVLMTHILGDGDNLLIGVRLPGKHEATILVYIDHNMGTIVKDAFVLDRPMDEVLPRLSKGASPGEYTTVDIPFADARARITPAIEIGAMTVPPFETETWPACRPFAQWIVSKMPEGGNGYSRPQWSDKQLGNLAAEFFTSKFGAALKDDDHESLIQSIFWFGTDYGPGDPLRWSPTAVEIFLADWMARKVMAPVAYLRKTPDLLRAFVRFCHAKLEIPGHLTKQTLAAIDHYEPQFYELIEGDDDLYGDDDEDNVDWGDDEAVAEAMLKSFARPVGGIDALNQLNTAPLPDEAFDWSEIFEDVHVRVAEVLALVDGCCDTMFDAEFRTAARRFLSRVAVADPDIFRRKGAPPPAAAAVCWVIGKVNGSFNLYGGSASGPLVKDMMAHFGLTGSASQRAETMMRAVVPDHRYGETIVGDPELLVAAARTHLIEVRDRFQAMLAAREPRA